MSVIERAEQKLKEEDEAYRAGADNGYSVSYWAAYLDGARAQKKECERKNPYDGLVCRTKEFCDTVKDYSRRMDDLANELTENL